jgi:hypothetical protein
MLWCSRPPDERGDGLHGGRHRWLVHLIRPVPLFLDPSALDSRGRLTLGRAVELFLAAKAPSSGDSPHMPSTIPRRRFG